MFFIEMMQELLTKEKNYSSKRVIDFIYLTLFVIITLFLIQSFFYPPEIFIITVGMAVLPLGSFILSKATGKKGRKNFENELKPSDENFRTVVESLSYGIIIIQQDKVVYSNSAAKNITLLLNEGKIGYESLTRIFHREDRLKIFRLIKDFKSGNINKSGVEVRIRLNETEDKWFCCTAEKLIFSHKYSVVVSFKDITERKNAEKEIGKYISELQANQSIIEQNAGRLQELNELLSKSEKKLKEMNSDKDKFFSIISHDLRSPFNSLLGFTEILSNEIDDLTKAEIRVFSRNINTSSKNLVTLLNSLLEWSRLNNGKISYNPEMLDLNLIVDEIIVLLLGNASQKNIHLDRSIPDDMFVFADKQLLNSILQNLISNAIKFSFRDSVVTVGAREDEDKIIVSVEDNGTGLNTSDIKKLFRIDIHYSTKGTDNEVGSGLGLILCKGFVELNRGNIWVESKIGEGSTFYFSLPNFNKKPIK